MSNVRYGLQRQGKANKKSILFSIKCSHKNVFISIYYKKFYGIVTKLKSEEKLNVESESQVKSPSFEFISFGRQDNVIKRLQLNFFLQNFKKQKYCALFQS